MTQQPVMTAEAVNAFIDREFPQMHAGGRVYRVTGVAAGEATLLFEPNDNHLRPGGTVSGPSMFALADLVAYAAILAHLGPVALAVTTNLNISFLRKPPLVPLVGHCRILKLGKRLAVVEVGIRLRDDDELVAHATATYSIPPR